MDSFPAPPQPGRPHRPGVAPEDLWLILSKTPQQVWQALRGQHIFLTGGTGFVGCWLLEALIWADQELGLGLHLSVLSRRPDAFRAKAPHLATHPIVSLLEGDVTDLGRITQAFDIVIHAATDVARADTDPRRVFDDILNGTKETLALTTRCKAGRYLLTSSGAVYGRQPGALTHVAESYPGAPDTMDACSAYGQAKRASEWLVRCHAEQHATAVGIARCFAFVGPYLPLDAHFAVGNFIRDGLQRKTILVQSDGTAYRSYLYAADMVVWLLAILVNGHPGQAYNVGSAHGITIGALAEQVAALLPLAGGVRIVAAATAGAPVQRYVPDTDKALAELQLAEYTDLASALRKTIDWAARNSGAREHDIGQLQHV